MICSKCGKYVDKNSRFCGACGAPVEEKTICPTCGKELSPGAVFCTNCGTRQDTDSVSYTGTETADWQKQMTGASTAAKPETNTVSRDKQTGKQIRKMSGVTKFFGTPGVGVANKIGILTIYDDRVEFVRKAGLTLAGTLRAAAKSEVETYYYSDCTSITTGSYMMAYVTLVLNLKNGNKVSFCPAIPVSRDMETVANLIQHYL